MSVPFVTYYPVEASILEPYLLTSEVGTIGSGTLLSGGNLKVNLVSVDNSVIITPSEIDNSVDLSVPVVAGLETLAASDDIISVANTSITATSVVLANYVGTVDATATLITTIILNAGTGFDIVFDAAATTGAKASWHIVKF